MNTYKSPITDVFEKSSYLSAQSAGYIEALYENYLSDPQSVSAHWQDFFSSLPSGDMSSHAAIKRSLTETRALASVQSRNTPAVKQSAVDALITAYRRFGHLNAKVDPLQQPMTPDNRLQLSHYGLADSDLKETFDSRQLLNGLSQGFATLETIVSRLKKIYCESIGIEYTRIADEEEREWLRHYIEAIIPNRQFDPAIKKEILRKLTQAEGLEKYLDTRYPGQKRFSIEGGETLIPMLDRLTHQARSYNVREIVIGMAHRGRINVLLNIMGQSPKELFQEFEGTKDFGMTSGDVKYHRGFSSDLQTDSGEVHLSLMFNPSHLEFINPVVLGSVRARQERSKEMPKRDYAVPILIHGDGAFAGQGVVMETLAMSQTRAYTVGGAIHIILNNQVVFTTHDPQDTRSSHYCSDLAKMIDAPILHVNADDPEACVRVMQLALDYRMRFHKDVLIDLVCYRVHGHNEADDPTCTQPLMYQMIKAKKTQRTLYAQQLMNEQIVTLADVDQLIDRYRERLDEGRAIVELVHGGLSHHYTANWTPFLNQLWTTQVDTTVSPETLRKLGGLISKVPDHFTLQRNVDMIMKAREKMTQGLQPLDWGYAETMAYATLLNEGCPVRLTGEDSRRGTFFHRHAAIFDQKTGEAFMPLLPIAKKQAHCQIYDSLLSEVGALGFEYGYASADPQSLVMWEAQFGDFANVAQVIIDQFISSGWQKWSRLSALVMLLPHGSEGMGPEHSSARLERYMQLCAQDNIQVCVPSTPAQMFHLLRRQVLRPYRKPLIVMTPKSLLRHKLAVSSLDDLSHGQFQCVIPEIDDIAPEKVTRLALCAGKVYYELLTKRREQNLNHVAILRIEQLYPFPYQDFSNELAKYPNIKEVVWAQEEPRNQGAWFCSRHRIIKSMQKDGVHLYYAGRDAMAAPAAGYPALHQKQQTELVDKALGLLPALLSK